MGLIEAHPGRGSFVKEISPDAAINPDIVSVLLADEHIWALHEARELLEVQIAGLAAQRATEDDLVAIEGALRKLEDAVATGQSVYDPGLEFHFALVKAAHNPVLVNLYHPIMGLLQEYQRPVYEEYSDAQAEIEQHRDIFESVRQGDSKLAQETMRKHLGYVISTTKQAIPEAFARE
jgi:GntR family transcriptional repressor for pyruvate dehydrogenase complex